MSLKTTTTSIKALIAIIIAITISPTGTSQIIDLRLCDSVYQLSITPQISVFRTTEKFGLPEILKPTTQFTQAEDETVLVYNYDPYYYWFRFILHNSDNVDKDVMLIMAPVGMREGKLYQHRDDTWQMLHQTGIKYRFRDRPYPFMHNVFPVRVGAGATDTLYLYADANGSNKTFGFAMMKPKDLKIFESRTYFVFGIIVGLLALFCIFNISLYFVLKVKTNLWYALYIGFLFLIVMKNDHLDQQFLLFQFRFLHTASWSAQSRLAFRQEVYTCRLQIHAGNRPVYWYTPRL
ncbi:MAG: hypothetical protein EOO00_08665 [Chitinophagaceae bacterium]|nr:MAG: hypothetical protein EOO00_08665 [Chitinophagaceae bacterium]